MRPWEALSQLLAVLGQERSPALLQSLVSRAPDADPGADDPEALAQAARRLGFVAVCVRQPLAALDVPALILLDAGGAAVALRRHGAGRSAGRGAGSGAAGPGLVLRLPGAGDMVVPEAELAASYAGVAVQVRRAAGEPAPLAEPPITMAALLRAQLPQVGGAVLLGLGINAFVLAASLAGMVVYDHIIPARAWASLTVLAAAAAALHTAELALRLLRIRLQERQLGRADVALTIRVYRRLLGMRADLRPAAPSAILQYVRDADAQRDGLAAAAVTLSNLPFLLLFLGAAALVGGPLALIPLGVVLVLVVTAGLTQARLIRSIRDATQAQMAKLALVLEAVTDLDGIKRTRREARLEAAFAAAAAAHARHARRQRTLGAVNATLTAFLPTVGATATMVLGSVLAIEGSLTGGALIAASALTSRAVGAATEMIAAVPRLVQALTAWRALQAVVNAPQERDAARPDLAPSGAAREADFVPLELAGAIRFEAVATVHGAAGEARPGLRGLSFALEAGERCLILGPNGAGKSSIERVLSGLQRPAEGRVVVDGVELGRIDPFDLRRGLGVLPQAFGGHSVWGHSAGGRAATVFELLAAQRPGLARERALAVLAELGGDGFAEQGGILTRPVLARDGGRGLSGGELQLVGLAAALLGEGAILFLDEPTAHLDPEAARRVVRAVDRHVREGARGPRTLLVTTHGHSPLWAGICQKILLLEQGRAKLFGPAEAIMRQLAARPRAATLARAEPPAQAAVAAGTAAQ